MATQQLLTIAEVARRLRVTPITVKRWIEDGALDAIPMPLVGKHERTRYRVRASPVEKLFERAK